MKFAKIIAIITGAAGMVAEGVLPARLNHPDGHDQRCQGRPKRILEVKYTVKLAEAC
jgi:hypothetical protein